MNPLRTTFLMALLTVILVTVGGALGGEGGMMFAFVFALAMSGISYWFSDKMVLRMYRDQEVTSEQAPKLHRVVQELALRAQIPMPRLYVIPDEAPNAFAKGRNENYATLAGAMSMVANMAHWGMIFGGRSDDERGGGHPIVALLMIFLAPLAAMLVQMAISRSREFGADATGAAISDDPLSLANALRKLERGTERIPMEANPATAHMFIVNPLTGGGLMSLFSPHPPIEERVRRLEKMR